MRKFNKSYKLIIIFSSDCLLACYCMRMGKKLRHHRLTFFIFSILYYMNIRHFTHSTHDEKNKNYYAWHKNLLAHTLLPPTTLKKEPLNHHSFLPYTFSRLHTQKLCIKIFMPNNIGENALCSSFVSGRSRSQW